VREQRARSRREASPLDRLIASPALVSMHTPPEMFVERRICGRLVGKILRNACAVCLHRDRVPLRGVYTCQLFGRRYPQCGSDGRALRFEIDETALVGFTEGRS
jgi:hypothetical protein